MRRKESDVKILLFILCAVVFTYHLGSALPIIESEKFYFQSVKEMFARHDWITPYYQGQFRFQKPILFYWLVSGSYLIFGENNFAVRFPSALFGVLTVILTFNIGRKLFDRKTGFLAAGLLATFAIFFMYARYSSPDMALTFFVTYALYLFLKGLKAASQEKRFFAFFFVVLGFATLNKGYVGFLLPLIVVFTFIISSRKWKLFKSLHLPLGIFIILLIALPWYILMYKLHGAQYLNHIFGRETAWRMFYAPNNEQGMAFLASYFKRFLFYVPVVFVWLAPHSLFLPFALADAFKSKNTYSREKDSYKLILSFFFGIFVFFSLISIKEYHYILPLAPAGALIIARYLINLEERGAQFRTAGFIVPYALITLALTAAIAVILYTMRHLYPAQVAAYEYVVILTPLILIVPYVKKKGRFASAALPVTMGLFLIFLSGRAIPLLNDNSLYIFAEEIKQTITDEDDVGVGSVNISQQRLGVYLDRRIEEANMKGNYPGSIDVHKTRIKNFLTSGHGLYFVISKEDYDNLVPEKLKSGLALMDKRQTWKSRLKGNFDKEVFMQMLRGQKDLLKDVLRHEVYLLTNKKDT